MTEAATSLRSIVVERLIAHPPQKIWRALTDSALVAEWLMKNDFAPVVGHRFNFRAQPSAYWNGVIKMGDAMWAARDQRVREDAAIK